MLVKHLDEEGKWNGTYDWSGPMRYLTLALDGFSDYTQCRTEDAVLLPFNSYFIQSTGEGKLIFDIDQSPADLPAFVQNDNEEVTLDIALSDSLGADVTGLLISQSFTTEYEYNADLAKLIGGNEQLCVYTLDDNMMLAFMAIDPVYAAQQLIPVGYKAKSMGNKTFSLRHRTQAACDFQSVSLIDYATGIVTELLTDDYSFTPASLHDDSRFAINAVVSRMPQTPTDISDVDQDDLGKFAAMQPGIYTVLGIKVADLNQPAMQLQPGVYIIVTDNQVRKEILK
ncbi:MAG: hypothetical protein MJZ82_05765, partial [Paludibacteraceae bacterium]|nr:hypothetical protein [Paludibacteraceae bacterium]